MRESALYSRRASKQKRSVILIKNASCGFLRKDAGERVYLVSEDGVIADIGKGKPPRISNATIIDARGLFLLPGFIDLHVHGGGSASIHRASSRDVERICRTHARFGTTGLLVTTFPDTRERLAAQVKAVSQADDSLGARIFGIHIESPHLNPEKAGGMPRERLRPFSAAELASLCSIANYPVRMVTFAPEIEGADEIISFCNANGIIPSVAHTCASAEAMRRAIEDGVRHATHIFNTFVFPENARMPGALETLLLDERVTVQLIADLVTVKEEFVKLLLLVKGWRKVALITDAGSSAGVRGAPEVMRSKDGRITASTLTMNRAIRSMLSLGLPLHRACAMASKIPARILSLDKHKGTISVEKDTDLVLVDSRCNVHLTVCEGVIVHARKGTVMLTSPLLSPQATP
jgi:N-acetylglucosamine-6-phosphate deacetylase